MRLVIQRVKKASVKIEEKITGEIGEGLLIFLGIGESDTKEIAEFYVQKLLKLRIFADEEGKTNCSILQVGGELLVVSQFTLYADCRKGNRPSFTKAKDPKEAEEIYQYFVSLCKKEVATGEFGADMQVSLLNDGPFTVLLGEELIEKKPNGV